MTWEQRERGGWYYYRAEKRDGRVYKQYIGSGPLAALIAAEDTEERRKRDAETDAWRRHRAKLDTLESQVADYCEAVATLSTATLCTVGFYRHQRT